MAKRVSKIYRDGTNKVDISIKYNDIGQVISYNDLKSNTKIIYKDGLVNQLITNYKYEQHKHFVSFKYNSNNNLVAAKSTIDYYNQHGKFISTINKKQNQISINVVDDDPDNNDETIIIANFDNQNRITSVTINDSSYIKLNYCKYGIKESYRYCNENECNIENYIYDDLGRLKEKTITFDDKIVYNMYMYSGSDMLPMGYMYTTDAFSFNRRFEYIDIPDAEEKQIIACINDIPWDVFNLQTIFAII